MIFLKTSAAIMAATTISIMAMEITDIRMIRMIRMIHAIRIIEMTIMPDGWLSWIRSKTTNS
jgi:hypothetical protein